MPSQNSKRINIGQRTIYELSGLPSRHADGAIQQYPLPITSEARLAECSSFRVGASEKERIEPGETLLYLAYGSNLCAETFQGRRGIRPISAVNVVVPSLEMVFDLPGIAYSEPCFANSRIRGGHSVQVARSKEHSEFVRQELISRPSVPDFKNPEWSKGLVGVVYEVTPQDYAHIIETEGGGAAYLDLEVECFPLSPGTKVVPEHPSHSPFKAHTLFAPAGGKAAAGPRVDGWAQASARYLKLITDGGVEHRLPEDYMRYLFELQPYTITMEKQRVGQFVFTSTWSPWFTFLFGLMKRFSDDKGRAPRWLVWLLGAVAAAAWASYDNLFKGIFGEGERTVEPDPDSALPDLEAAPLKTSQAFDTS